MNALYVLVIRANKIAMTDYEEMPDIEFVNSCEVAQWPQNMI